MWIMGRLKSVSVGRVWRSESGLMMLSRRSASLNHDDHRRCGIQLLGNRVRHALPRQLNP